jgi:hypothetical protein
MSADLQTREQMLAEYNKRMDEVERKKPTVTITRAEYEALMTAATDITECEKFLDADVLSIAAVRRIIKRSAAALRAAGIQIEGE